MRFLHSAQLVWASLLAVAVALYLFRRRPRTVRVSTLLFFKSLAREHQESAWLRRLKRLLSFLLSALVILGAAGSLARPVVAPPAGSLRNVVVLLDRSASMAARDGHGRARLAEAKRLLRERLAGLPGAVAVTVMAYDRRPEILQPRTLDRYAVRRALERVEVRPIEGDPASALSLARRLAALETPACIWHATDEPEEPGEAASPGHKPSESPDAPAPEAEVHAERLNVALAEPVNAGITAFRMRPLPLGHGQYEAFVQVHGTLARPLEAELELHLDGALVALRSIGLEPGPQSGGASPRVRLLVPIEAGEARKLSLRLSAPGDALELDNEVHAYVPELVPVRVLWVSEEPDPFTALALSSIGRDGSIEVYTAKPEAWPPEERADVVILDGWLPETWPAGPAAGAPRHGLIVVNPPEGSPGPVRAARLRGDGLPLDAVRVVDERHPVLYGVASARVAVTQTAVVETGDSLAPLWVGPSGAVLAAGELRGQRLVVMAFAPGRSEHLPLLASYPLLMGNAVYWCARGADASGRGTTHRTGELIEVEGGALLWPAPGERGAREKRVPVRGRWVELDRVGLWRTEADGREVSGDEAADSGRTGSAALLSRRETMLPAAPVASAGAGAAPAAPAHSLPFRGDLTDLFLWAVALVLVIESWLFHRRAVY